LLFDLRRSTFERMSDRDLVLDAVQKMPEEASLAEIMNELALLARVKDRLAKVESNPSGVPNEEVGRMLRQWITK
jgi:hypothetical protein